MKKIYILFVLLFLTACSSSNLNNDLDNLFNNIENINIYSTNNNLKYYSYYLPSDLGEKEITSDSITLSYGESKIIMNLNISDIINSKYYSDSLLNDDGFFNENYLVYEKSGTFTLKDETTKQYTYKLYDYDKYYVLYFKTNDIVFYGNIVKGDVKDVTRQLLIVAKSIDADEELVIADYSSKDTIDYQKKQIDLFNKQMPVEGSLSEMLTDDATIGNGETSTNNNEESETETNE